MDEPFTPNEPFDRVFLLKGIDERQTRTGKPYLAMTLGTSEGAWEARIWDMAMSSLPGLTEGDPVHAKGAVQLYQDKVQLIIESISKAEKPVDPRTIYPAAASSEKKLREDFNGFVCDLKDPSLVELMQLMLADKAVSDEYFTCPAAISMHHARIGGLAEHSINVCKLALNTRTAAPWLDPELLTVGSLLHDIGKIREYEVTGDFRHTLEGKFLGHIIQGHSLVDSWIRRIPNFPERLALDVLHILLSHHGQLEYGSPKTPVTAEALVIHFADDLDAKLDMVKTAGEVPGTEEAFVRGLRRSFQYRGEAPPEGVRGRMGEGEKKTEAGIRGNGETGTKEPDAGTRRRGDVEVKEDGGGQEELF